MPGDVRTGDALRVVVLVSLASDRLGSRGTAPPESAHRALRKRPTCRRDVADRPRPRRSETFGGGLGVHRRPRRRRRRRPRAPAPAAAAGQDRASSLAIPAALPLVPAARPAARSTSSRCRTSTCSRCFPMHRPGRDRRRRRRPADGRWAARRTSTYQPEQIDVRLDDVVGVDAGQGRGRPLAEPLPRPPEFTDKMGGRPRRGLLFEGAPGTGKTLPRQGHGRRGRRAVPVRLRDRVPVDVLRRDRPQDPLVLQGAAQDGASARAAPSASSRRSTPSPAPAAAWSGRLTTVAARPASPRRSAAAGRRSAGRPPATVVNPNSVVSEGTGGVVNELLVQMQSFDEPTGAQKVAGSVVDVLNRLPAAAAPASASRAAPAERPARRRDQPGRLARPGAAASRPLRPPAHLRPAGQGRRAAQLIDHFLDRRPHAPELDDPEHRDALAAVTAGLLAGQARAPARRGSGQRGAPRRRRDELERRRAGPADQRGRARRAGRLHRRTSGGSSPPTRPATRPWPGSSRRSAGSRC